jgi:hypothetical protein
MPSRSLSHASRNKLSPSCSMSTFVPNAGENPKRKHQASSALAVTGRDDYYDSRPSMLPLPPGRAGPAYSFRILVCPKTSSSPGCCKADPSQSGWTDYDSLEKNANLLSFSGSRCARCVPKLRTFRPRNRPLSCHGSARGNGRELEATRGNSTVSDEVNRHYPHALA